MISYHIILSEYELIKYLNEKFPGNAGWRLFLGQEVTLSLSRLLPGTLERAVTITSEYKLVRSHFLPTDAIKELINMRVLSEEYEIMDDLVA